jgi:hypothetical protein
VTRATASKVSRLLMECRVKPAGCASVYRVAGDNAVYRVILGEDFSSCDCQATVPCSHLRAARLLHEALDADEHARFLVKRPGVEHTS